MAFTDPQAQVVANWLLEQMNEQVVFEKVENSGVFLRITESMLIDMAPHRDKLHNPIEGHVISQQWKQVAIDEGVI